MRPSGRHLLLVPVVALGEVGVDVEKVNLVTRGLHKQTNRKIYTLKDQSFFGINMLNHHGGG